MEENRTVLICRKRKEHFKSGITQDGTASRVILGTRIYICCYCLKDKIGDSEAKRIANSFGFLRYFSMLEMSYRRNLKASTKKLMGDRDCCKDLK